MYCKSARGKLIVCRGLTIFPFNAHAARGTGHLNAHLSFFVPCVRQYIFENEKTVQPRIPITLFKVAQQFVQLLCINACVNRALISCKNGVFFAPHLCPVYFVLYFFARVLNGIFYGFDVHVKTYQFVQRKIVQNRHSFCLAYVW